MLRLISLMICGCRQCYQTHNLFLLLSTKQQYLFLIFFCRLQNCRCAKESVIVYRRELRLKELNY